MIKNLLFLTSFEYPTQHAHPHHALLMAREFNALLPGAFRLVVSRAARELGTVPHTETAGPLAFIVRTLRLRSAYYTVWLPLFLILNPKFRGAHALLFVNDTRLAAVAALWKPLFNFKLAVEVHTTMKSGVVRTLVLRRADLLIFLTEGLRTRTLGSTLVHPHHVVLGNAVDALRFEVAQSKEELRKELSLPTNATLIGYIGRFRPGGIDKGIEFMLSVLPSLPSDIHMVLVGGTPTELKEVAQLTSQRGLNGRVHAYGRVTDVERWCAACDMLAYVPSELHTDFLQYETSPMKLFEYMAARRPVIVTDAPTVRSVVSEKEAHIIASGDQNAFVRAVEEILAHPKQSEILVHAAAEKVHTLTWHARARTILASI
jgi:glycosyltransferase involved in cell wall biosynthesis